MSIEDLDALASARLRALELVLAHNFSDGDTAEYILALARDYEEYILGQENDDDD